MYIIKYKTFKNNKKYILKESIKISNDLKYHIDNDIDLFENVFRYGSVKYFEFINYVRDLYLKESIKLSTINEELINSDIGKKAMYRNIEVWLDIPYLYEAKYKNKDVELNKPKRSNSGKKFYVYVKKPDGKIKKVRFGAAGGGHKLAVKLNDPKARKRFADRHKCEQKNDKTKPGYWSCRLPRFASSLNLSGSGKWW